MLTTCEPYRLLAIQPNGASRDRLRWADAAHGALVTSDVGPYRERKVRLLNGAHTTMVPLAILAGCETVREAMEHAAVGSFIRRVLLDEILPTVDAPDAERFAREVLDRFANPYIRHQLTDITLQGTMKLRVRVVPTLLAHAAHHGSVPPALALGLAAHLVLLRPEHAGRRKADAQGERVVARWAEYGGDARGLVRSVLGDAALWGTSLDAIPELTDRVSEHVVRIARDGALAALGDLSAETRPS